jgi:uncharacterized membrane protein
VMFLISIPSFFEILFSHSAYFSIWYHYSALIIPVMFIATIKALSYIRDWKSSLGNQLYTPILCILIISSVFCAVNYSPASKQIGLIGTFNEAQMNNHYKYVDNLIKNIPDEASISTQFNLLPMISTHRQISVDRYEEVDVILIDDAFAWRSRNLNDNLQKIKDKYDLILKENYLSFYVNKKNPHLKSEINSRLRLGSQYQNNSG